MVVAVAVLELLEVKLGDVVPHLVQGGKIHRGPSDGQDLAGSHVGRVHGGEGRGVDIQLVVADAVVRGIAGEVEIGVVGHVDDGRGGAGGLVGDINRTLIRERVGHESRDGAREIVVPVRGIDAQANMLRVGLHDLVGLVLPAGGSAVQAVPEIVLRQVIFHPVKGELALGDAVGIAADGGAEVGLVVLGIVVLDLVEAQHHVTLYPVLVRQDDGHDTGAEVGDGHFHPGFVL